MSIHTVQRDKQVERNREALESEVKAQMLILGQKKNDKIQIGDDIILTIVDIGEGGVKLGIEAPDDVIIRRKSRIDGQFVRGYDNRNQRKEARDNEHRETEQQQ